MSKTKTFDVSPEAERGQATEAGVVTVATEDPEGSGEEALVSKDFLSCWKIQTSQAQHEGLQGLQESCVVDGLGSTYSSILEVHRVRCPHPRQAALSSSGDASAVPSDQASDPYKLSALHPQELFHAGPWPFISSKW